MDITNAFTEQHKYQNLSDSVLKFEFTEVQGCYNTLIEYKTNSILAVYDTGATRSALDIYSLSVLTGYSASEIYKAAKQWILSGRKTLEINTASGKIDKAICISISDVTVADMRFRKFYAYLNVSNELWKTSGKVEMEDGEIKEFTPLVLIGLDIRRSGKVISEGDTEYIVDFNYEQYISKWPSEENSVLNIFSIIQ